MTMRLALVRANVAGPEGSGHQWAKVTVDTRGEKLTVRDVRGKVLHEVAASAVVPQPSGKEWRVTTEQGVYVITRQPGGG